MARVSTEVWTTSAAGPIHAAACRPRWPLRRPCGQPDVHPAGEQALRVPGALSVPQQDQRRHGASLSAAPPVTRSGPVDAGRAGNTAPAGVVPLPRCMPVPRRYPGGSRPSAFILAARAARHRRRRRPERVRGRGRQADGGPRRRGGHLHPRGDAGCATGRRVGARRARPARAGRPVRDSTRATCPPSCATSPSRCCGPRRPTPRPLRLVHGITGSPHVGAVAKERWGVPLVQSMHTLAGEERSAGARRRRRAGAELRGEADVVAAADRLVANTDEEARQLAGLYGPTGQDLDRQPRRRPVVFRPGRRSRRGAGSGCPPTVTSSCSRAGSSRSSADVALRAAAVLVRDNRLARS